MSKEEKYRHFVEQVKQMPRVRKDDGKFNGDADENRNSLVLDMIYHYGSDSSHLRYSQDFSHEHQMYLQNQFNWRQLVRCICLVLLIAGYALNLITWPLYEQYTMFSSWTMHLTTLSIITTLTAVRSKNFKYNIWYIFANHIFYSFSIPFNLMVVVLYWSLVHPVNIEKHRADGPWYKVVCQYWIHIVPAVSCLANSAISNIVLSRKPILIQFIFGFSYCMLNYGMTRLHGRPIYAFMPWDTFLSTFRIVLALLIFYGTLYWVLCKIDEAFKANLVKRRDAMGLADKVSMKWANAPESKSATKTVSATDAMIQAAKASAASAKATSATDAMIRAAKASTQAANGKVKTQ